ncbi:MAG: hypothetical protein JXM74_04665 [Fusobacteriaceae bacterium]|nr:hypothetical protein [Fusobacteriaceae bacterium]MBN2838028.1 hypothetical protein [Fusobacteriaceae bacterium]
MKKRIKVFEPGKYPQGEYDFSRVQKIFGNIKDKVKTQLAHTSKAKGRKIILGEFDNFEVQEDGKVYADIEFNPKGTGYYEDGALEGISVEIPNDKLTKIACLPLGVKPQIEGAEFEIKETFIFEFEEIIDEEAQTMDFASILAWIIANKLTVEQISQLFGSLKQQITDKEAINKLAREFEKEELTTEQLEEKIRNEMKAEFEAKEKNKTSEAKAKEFMEKNKLKITPGMKEVLNETTIQEFYKVDNCEFEKSKISAGELLEKAFEKMPELIKLGELENEFGKEENNNSLVEAAKAQWGIK